MAIIRVDSIAEHTMNRGLNSSRHTRHSWGRYASGCFGGAAALLTATAAMFAFGRLNVAFAIGGLVIALALFAAGFHARRKADVEPGV